MTPPNTPTREEAAAEQGRLKEHHKRCGMCLDLCWGAAALRRALEEACEVLREEGRSGSADRCGAALSSAAGAEVLRELAELRESANKSICAWCGWIGPKEADAILAHQNGCEKRTGALEAECRELAELRDKLDEARLHRDQLYKECCAALVREKALEAERDALKKRLEEAREVWNRAQGRDDRGVPVISVRGEDAFRMDRALSSKKDGG
jgi:hypothetical protein